jgi:hypothetical protein
MSADTTPVYAAAQTRPTSALAKLTLTEARLLLREPVALFWGLAFPMALLAVMGLASSGPQSDLGGLRLVAVYEPILIAFVTVAFAIQGLPGVVAGYRERRILRRMATTPVGPVRVVGPSWPSTWPLRSLRRPGSSPSAGSASGWRCQGSRPGSSLRMCWQPSRCSVSAC